MGFNVFLNNLEKNNFNILINSYFQHNSLFYQNSYIEFCILPKLVMLGCENQNKIKLIIMNFLYFLHGSKLNIILYICYEMYIISKYLLILYFIAEANKYYTFINSVFFIFILDYS